MEDKEIIDELGNLGWDVSKQALHMLKNLRPNPELLKTLSDHVRSYKKTITGGDITGFLVKDFKAYEVLPEKKE